VKDFLGKSPPIVAFSELEPLVIQTVKELYDNADSTNMYEGDMKIALDW
jgi:hypothetical protein